MEPVHKHLLESITGPLWEKIGIRNRHGINLSLSALYSKESSGIGEFYDLIPLIDWCKKLHIDIIQLLPLNSSEEDPSPYNAISSCAINFVHLSLQKLPYLDVEKSREKLKTLSELNKSQRVLYQEVLNQKLIFLHEYFEDVKERLIQTQEFKDYISSNPWVEPYALFRSLKDHLNHTPWDTWPNEVKSPSKEQYDKLMQIYQPQILFYMALQYLCYLQLREIHNFAKEAQILLMGDVPILLSPDSADVWQYPEYFDIHLAAGSPPDAYNLQGQYWGFPLFRWDVIRKNQFLWWKQRLNYASLFFDLFRVDHIVGFFRIWAIPLGKKPEEGCFLPPDETEWDIQGRELIKMITQSSTMLPIAEDLGTVPVSVRPILEEFGICGTKVMRWMRKWDQKEEFIPVGEYPPISLTTVSTHDSPTLQQWWEKSPEEAKAFAQFKNWEYTPILSNAYREEILKESHRSASLFHINLLQEYLALFPELVYANPDEERINVPGQILPTNWTYRFRCSIEELTSHEALAKAMTNILTPA
ncbi:MAG: 4-alpha-glucanotransferase [Chlamydiales bacterium]|nr:4-alpha-glucanotransferase [Chlamydiales bacterium]